MNRKIIDSTPFGSVVIVWTGTSNMPKVVRILLSQPGLPAQDRVSELYPASLASSCAGIEDIAVSIKEFLEGARIEFSLDVVDLDSCSEFQQRVLRAEHRIPRGSVSTYRLISTHLGKKNGARAVGKALATNPFPLIVPCHRAIRSDRHLGGYQGGFEMKRALLEKEGIRFDNSGRIAGARLHYDSMVGRLP